MIGGTLATTLTRFTETEDTYEEFEVAVEIDYYYTAGSHGCRDHEGEPEGTDIAEVRNADTQEVITEDQLKHFLEDEDDLEGYCLVDYNS